MTRLATLFQRALDAIRRDCPAAWTELVRVTGPLAVSFEIDDERFSVVGTNCEVRVEAARPASEGVHITTTVERLRNLILGETGLVDSVEREDVFVRGAPSDLVTVDRMTWLAVAGAARSASAAPLLEELLA
jgi:hypothetical protein